MKALDEIPDELPAETRLDKVRSISQAMRMSIESGDLPMGDGAITELLSYLDDLDAVIDGALAMPYPTNARKFLETRALSPGEVRVRIMKGDTLLYSKIGYKSGPGAVVEYMGARHAAEQYGQTWRLDITKVEEESVP